MSDAIHGHFTPIGCPDCKEAADKIERLTGELGRPPTARSAELCQAKDATIARLTADVQEAHAKTDETRTILGYVRAENKRLTEELGKLRNDYDYAVDAWNKEIDRNALAAKEDTK